MSIFKSYGSCLQGADAHLIEVEVGTSKGLPQETIVGLAENVVRESKSRIRTAILQSDFNYPLLHYTINLAPADIKKNGSLLDLPIAVGVLGATKQYEIPENTIFLGELSLDGALKKIPYAMPICYSLQKQFPKHKIVLPKENYQDVSILQNSCFEFCDQLRDIASENKAESAFKFPVQKNSVNSPSVKQSSKAGDRESRSDIQEIDFAHLIGLEHVKKALLLALIGKHNVLLIGPPGSGKSQLLKCLPDVLTPLSVSHQIENLRIQALLGKSMAASDKMPVESPHHTISYAGMFGGGNPIKPGVISLAHEGVLILDELPEFKRSILEGLRQPLEDKVIQISRVKEHMTFPANCQVFATMNPCPCGFFSSQSALCSCKTSIRDAYKNRISGPILDRFEMIIEVPKIEVEKSVSATREIGLSSAQIRDQLLNCTPLKFQKPNTQSLIQDYPELFQKLLKNKFITFRSLKHIVNIALSLCRYYQKDALSKEVLLEACQYRKTHLFEA